MANAMLDFFDKDYFYDDCQCEQRHDGYCDIHNSTNISLTPNSERASPKWPSIKRKAKSEMDSSKVSKVIINQSYPKQPTSDSLVENIEYRLKLKNESGVVFAPGEQKIIKTTTEIARKAGKLSMLMKPPDNLTLRFLSEGFISPSFRGDISVSLQNATNEEVHLSAGTVVGFLIMSPFVV